MRVRSRPVILLGLLAALAAACGGDRTTGPGQDDAAQAAAEFERAAAELGFIGGPAALTYSSAASALRGGARIAQVDIIVDGVTEKWNALGHEIEFELPAGSELEHLPPPRPLRALLAWRPSPAGMRIIHLLGEDESGAVGRLFPDEGAEDVLLVWPSHLLYADGRNSLWQAVSGEQTSRLVATGAACPAPPPRAASPLPPRTCVEASFHFGFSNVRAQPFVLQLGPGPPPTPATGSRALSMAEQSVAGVKIKVTLIAFELPPLALIRASSHDWEDSFHVSSRHLP
jgi:hypothetical protein